MQAKKSLNILLLIVGCSTEPDSYDDPTLNSNFDSILMIDIDGN